MNKMGFLSAAEQKPRCTVQGQWSQEKKRCVRACFPNRYFYPSSSGGKCYDKKTLIKLADPQCKKRGLRYDVVDAICVEDGTRKAQLAVDWTQASETLADKAEQYRLEALQRGVEA